jgi:hypothetical protein
MAAAFSVRGQTSNGKKLEACRTSRVSSSSNKPLLLGRGLLKKNQLTDIESLSYVSREIKSLSIWRII